MNTRRLNLGDFCKRIAVVASAVISLPSLLLSQSQSKRSNILFIMTDDHAFQALSCYGSRINQTPNLDRIANEGMRFNRSFCTNSICAPSRAVLLTGKYSHINGQIDNIVTFDGSQETFPQLLQQAGYQTAVIGKWHLKSDPTGFEYWKYQRYIKDYLRCVASVDENVGRVLDYKVKRHYGIRTERYKLIHFYYDIDAWEFFSC